MKQLSPSSEAYYRRKYAPLFNHVPFEEICPPGAKREEALKALKAALSTVGGFLDKNGDGMMFVMGEHVSWADFGLAATIRLAEVGLEPEEWEDFASWSGGRWAKYAKALSEWEDGVSGLEETFQP
jgi:glutathione S-transferase